MAETVFSIATAIAVLGLILSGYRFLKGPWAIDRTVALDVMTIIATSLIVAFAMFSGRRIYVDVGLVYGLVGFVGVVALARYLEGGAVMMAIIGAFTSLVGALFFLLSGIGLIRMPDAFNRMQAGTKATTLGSILFLIGIGLQKPDYLGRTIILVVFIVLTNPVSSNALARAAHGYRKHIGAKMTPDALAEANAIAEADEAAAKDKTGKEAAHAD